MVIFRHLRSRARLRRRELTEDEQAHIDWANGLLKQPGDISIMDAAALVADMEPPCEIVEPDPEVPQEWIEEAEHGYNICVDCKTVGTAAMCPKCGGERLW